MKNKEELLLILQRIENTLNDVHRTLRALADSQGDVIDSVYKIEAETPLETRHEQGSD